MEFCNKKDTHALVGEISVPADKSIVHRAVMFSSIANGTSKITTNFIGRDNLASIRIMQQLGVAISCVFPSELFSIAKEENIKNLTEAKDSSSLITVEGKGLNGLRAAKDVLDAGNSGTTARLLCGILATQNFESRLTGDESLVKRPFKRVIEPLSEMGASFSNEKLPFTVKGGEISSISFVSEKASAQVKSAILIAGLKANNTVTVAEPSRSRDHTERMLTGMGCEITEKQLDNGYWQVSVLNGPWTDKLRPVNIEVPGDFSSASFFIVAASIVPGSKVRILNIGVNPTRTGLLDVLKRMGADIKLLNQRTVCGEDIADIEICAKPLHGVQIDAADVVRAIDEIPILAVACSVATGKSQITGAAELRVKESDRLTKVRELLESFSIQVEEQADGLTIAGQSSTEFRYIGSNKESWRKSGDHRISMCGAICDYLSSGKFQIADAKAVETSFPTFAQCFKQLS